MRDTDPWSAAAGAATTRPGGPGREIAPALRAVLSSVFVGAAIRRPRASSGRVRVSPVVSRVGSPVAFLRVKGPADDGAWGGAAELADWSASSLRALVHDLRDRLAADQALAFGISREDPGQVEFVVADGLPATFARAFETWLPSAPVVFELFDPALPEARQRNRPLRPEDFPAPSAWRRTPFFEHVVGPWRLGPEALRVLVCDGARLLAWVGFFRHAPFGIESVRALRQSVPALRAQLRLHRRLSAMALFAAALPAVLDAIPAAAFVLGPRGGIRRRNRIGEALLRRSGDRLRREFRAHAEGRACRLPFSFHRIAIPGSAAHHHLAVQRVEKDDVAHRVTCAAVRWKVGLRAEHVLALVVRGASNRTIAARLGIAVGTVELYVSRLLAAAGAESRAELVAKFFTDAWR